MRTLSTVLFDLDGTLLDTAPDFIVVLRQLMQQRQCQHLLSDEAIRATVSEGAGALITLAFGHAPDAAEFEPLRQQLLDLYQRNGHARTRLFAGLAELLDWFDAAGIAWGVVTNKPSHYAVPLMQGLDLLPRCRTLVCPDHVTRRKPDPEPILLACRQLDRPVAHTLYIGDHRRDIEAGRAAGALTMAAAYGYVHPADPAEQWQADHLVRSVDEMASWLRQRLSAD